MEIFSDKDSNYYRLPSQVLLFCSGVVVVLGIVAAISTFVMSFNRHYENYQFLLWGGSLYFIISALITGSFLYMFNEIHEKMTIEPEDDLEKLFMCYIASNEQSKAKDLLINNIYKSDILAEIIEVVNHRNNDAYMSQLRNQFDNQFGKYISYLDQYNFNLDKIISHYRI